MDWIVKVGHNIYILCHQLAQHNKDLALLMKLSEDGDPNTNQALQYYANHTAQIEVKKSLPNSPATRSINPSVDSS